MKRSCVDCDGDAIEQKHCDATGHAANKTACNHYWGNWTEGPCVTTICNTEGERTKTRHCLYDEGSEAINVWLCFNGNRSAIMKEKCINSTIPAECLSQISSETGSAENKRFYVGIGVVFALIVILCILLVFVRYSCHKSNHFPSIDTANLNQTSPYKFTNATVKTSEQSGNVFQLVELSQQNPSDAHQFIPTTIANDRSFGDLKSMEQNKLEDELVEKTVAYDIAQIDGSNTCRFDQASDQDEYVIEISNVLNSFAIAMRTDPNVYEIKDAIQHAESNLPMAHSIEGDPEQNNTYSSLQSSGDDVESTYSRLEG